MKTSTPALATLDICNMCSGTGTRLAYPRKDRMVRCGYCAGKAIQLDIRADVLKAGYAIATRGEHIAVLAAALALVPKLRMYPHASKAVFEEVDAVLAQCADDVADRAVAAFGRAGCRRWHGAVAAE